MDSESDDDDILTSVPLLLAEEVPMSPRQIVLSYEPDTTCDKRYAKMRNGFQDKIHSASSKVQVHTGDKIQGNFEAISLETGDISNDKLQHNLSEVQENVKSKSKNSKPKKSKKNKMSKKCIAKTQDKSVIKKKCNYGVQETPNDNKLLNLKEEIKVSNEIPKILNKDNHCRLVAKVDECNIVTINNSSHSIVGNVEKDSQFANTDNSSHKNVDKVKEDKHVLFTDNSIDKNADKVEKDLHTVIMLNSTHKNTNKIEEDSQIVNTGESSHKNAKRVEEDSCAAITNNSGHRNKISCNSFFENCASKVQEKVINEIPKSSYKNVPTNASVVENNLNNTSKRSYADVVKAQSDTLDTDYNKEALIDKISDDESDDFPDLSDFFTVHEKTKNNEPELNDSNRKPKNKKNKADNFNKNKMQNEVEIESKAIPVLVPVSCHGESQENLIDKRDMLDKTAIILPQVQKNIDNEIADNGKNVSDIDTGKSNIQTPEKFNIRTFAEVVKSHTVLKDIDDSKSKFSQVHQNSEIIQDNSADKKEIVLTDVSERKLQGMSDAQEIENISVENLKDNNVEFQNDIIQDLIDDTYFGLPSNSDNENIVNFMNKCQNPTKVVNDNDKVQDTTTTEFKQNLDDGVLENIADLWDIYTKIQDISDDEMNEISDDEMNENFTESLQEISDIKMNENSDEQMTDDEMNENSMDEYEEISYDDVREKSFGKILKNFFEGENTKLYSKAFEYNAIDENEESDNDQLINQFILPSITSSMERIPELLQSFKCDFFDELKQNASEIPNHHSSCVPLTEYELVEYFNFEPQYFNACQSLQYPSSYALAIADYYANHDQYFLQYSEKRNTFVQKYKRRAIAENQTPPATNELRLTNNTAEILEKIMNQKCSVLPTKTGNWSFFVVLLCR